LFFEIKIRPLKTQNIKNKRPEDKNKYASEVTEETLARVYELAEMLCEAEGLEVVHVEHQRETRGRILRVYIDKPGGVGLNDCVHVSRQLGDLLDIYLDNGLIYNLEVSSPGPERPLGKASDFERFKGKLTKIKTRKSFAGQKSFTGKLLGITEGTVTLMLNDKIVAIPYQEITKARLVNNYGENKCL